MSDWKNELKELFDEEVQDRLRQLAESEGKNRVKRFISEVAVLAFDEIVAELKKYDRDLDVEIEGLAATIRVYHEGHEEFYFSIRSRPYRKKEFSWPVLPLKDDKAEFYRAELYLKDGPLYHDVTNYSKEQIIREFLHEYKRHMQWNL